MLRKTRELNTTHFDQIKQGKPSHVSGRQDENPTRVFLGTRSQAAQKTARAHSRQDDDEDDRGEGREGPASDSFYSYSVTLQ